MRPNKEQHALWSDLVLQEKYQICMSDCLANSWEGPTQGKDHQLIAIHSTCSEVACSHYTQWKAPLESTEFSLFKLTYLKMSADQFIFTKRSGRLKGIEIQCS